MRATRGLVGLLIVLVWCVAGCGPGPSHVHPLPTPQTPAAVSTETPSPSPSLELKLSDGAQTSAAETVPTALTTWLTAAQTLAVLQRMPPLKTTGSDKQRFALRDRSLPPPMTGETVKTAFPPPARPTPPSPSETHEPLSVLRYSPEGKVPVAPELSVTFSQSMVPVSSVAEVEAREVPVKLSPQPPGVWHWLGAKTLIFKPGERFNMATEYTVDVPAGTSSLLHGTLDKALHWTFRTPPPQLTASSPSGGPEPLDPVMFLEFDQPVDPDVVLKSLKINAGTLRLATEAETTAAGLSGTKAHWVAVKAEAPLPPDTTVSVTVGAGLQGLEGPLPTEAAQSFSFKTYGPFKIVDRTSNPVAPMSGFWVRLSNPIDTHKFKKAMVHVSPDIPELAVSVSGNAIGINGWTRGRTRYTVQVDGDLADVFGQTLGSLQTLTFQVGPAEASLSGSGANFIVADPNQPPAYSVLSTNYSHLKVRLYRVQPQDWGAFERFESGWNNEKDPVLAPGELLGPTDVSVHAAADETVETRIDLAPALKDGLGHVVVVVEPPAWPADRNGRTQVMAWVEVTRIGLDVCSDADHLVVWSNSLVDGKPLSGVAIATEPSGSGTTGPDGLLTLSLPAHTRNLTARLGTDVAFLPGQTWRQDTRQDELRWFVFDDRQMYRPAEAVHFKGWMRRIGAGTQGDVGAVRVSSVHYVLSDAQGNKIASGDRPVDALGGFDLGLTLPKTMNLGEASLALTAPGPRGVGELSTEHSIQVQEFRRPEFEVAAQAGDGPFFVGGPATATVTAKYYSGGPLPNATVNWNVTATPSSFTPPGRSDYSFGTWTAWWGLEGATAVFGATNYNRASYYGESGETMSLQATQTFASHTDGSGQHTLRLDVKTRSLMKPLSVHAEASVMDVNRQAWNASTDLLVHPSHVYVGLKSARSFVEPGQPLKIDVIVPDVDGKLVAGRKVQLHLVRQTYGTDDAGQYRMIEADAQDQQVTSAASASHVVFDVKKGGTWHLTAHVEDAEGHPNQSDLTLWVAGGEVESTSGVQQQAVTLIPDQRSWQPGETAEILVQAPFHPAEGLLTLRRSGLIKTERFHMDGSSYTVKIPVEDGYIPGLTAQVDLVGSAPRRKRNGDVETDAPPRPAYASGALTLSVPPLSRTLTVAVKPVKAALEPGAETAIDVDVRDARGQPVSNGQVAVVVADESVLALTGYRIPDPIQTFYMSREAGVNDVHSRASVLLADTAQEQDGGTRGFTNSGIVLGSSGGNRYPVVPSPMHRALLNDGNFPRYNSAQGLVSGDGGRAAAEPPPPPPPIQLRTNFNALATFVPSQPLNAKGHARIRFKLPDNLTRYRIMVVAVADGKQFGQGESTITARMPLMVRPSAPRFLNFGDRFELPVVVQNQTDKPMTVDVAVRASNLQLPKGSGQRVVVKANDRVEVRFPADTVEAGTARFQVAAASGKWADGSELSLPVWTPATTEAFATYGEIDQGALTQPVLPPGAVFPQFGGLQVTTSSTAVASLTDAVLYLEAYPYECSEQISSRVLAVAALKDVLTAFKAEGLPSPEAMLAAMGRDIARLHGMQHDDGGFSFWRRDDEEFPYLSVHVAHALVRAQEKGFKVPTDMLSSSKTYLKSIDSHIPGDYPDMERRAIQAYALYVRMLSGDRDAATARQIVASAGDNGLSMESVGWLLSVMTGDPGSESQVAQLRRLISNRVSETAGDAHFVTAYKDGEHLLLASDMRADGVLLDALIADQPKSDLIPKLVHGLLDHRVRGCWSSTQENAFVLLALDRYFNTYEHVTPDFVARVWLGNQYAGDHRFHGRTTERHEIDIPMDWLVQRPGEKPLVLAKDGPGRLYYRIGMQYAPQNLKLPPADYGFAVERTYQAVDNPKDVHRDADGTWHVKAGSRVQVELSMVSQSRRYHVALVDPLPAGLEAMNPSLLVTGTVPEGSRAAHGWWGGAWYEHQNLRDERAEAFTSLLWEGVYTYRYVCRATTPGTYVVPPTKAEEMYHPETFGRSASDRVVVESSAP